MTHGRLFTNRGTLAWRYNPKGKALAWLQTDNRETVAEISKGSFGGFYFRIYNPICWVIASDPDAVKARDEHGQAGVFTWGGPFRNRKAAVAAMLHNLDRASIGLFGLDTLTIEKWQP